MGGPLIGIALFWSLAFGLWAGVPAAQAAPRCAHRGEQVVIGNARLVMLRPSNRVRDSQGDDRIVCRRDSGERHRFVRIHYVCSSCGYSIEHEALRGRFAYAVLSSSIRNGQDAGLLRLDTRTWHVRSDSLTLSDQGEFKRTEVIDLITAPHGRAILRVRNDFAAGIVLVGSKGAAYLDEGLAAGIVEGGLAQGLGRPHLRGARVVWHHWPTIRSLPTLLPDRCPRAPIPKAPITPSGDSLPGQGQILSTADAVTSDRWFCVRSKGRVGQLDGAVVRLVGSLAVVQRPDDFRVVDLRSGATVNGPVANDQRSPCECPTVGRSGTLVFQRFFPSSRDTEIVARAAGMPERQLARGDIAEPRYEDGVIRYTYRQPFKTVTELVP